MVFHIYQDMVGKWRWYLTTPSGEKLAVSPLGYTRRGDCQHAIQRVREGHSLIEAMAARLPVVSTDVGGVAEVVVPEITGLLAPAGDDARLAEHLIQLDANRALAARLGRNGAVRAEDLFSFERMADGYARVFAETLGQITRTSEPTAVNLRQTPIEARAI